MSRPVDSTPRLDTPGDVGPDVRAPAGTTREDQLRDPTADEIKAARAALENDTERVPAYDLWVAAGGWWSTFAFLSKIFGKDGNKSILADLMEKYVTGITHQVKSSRDGEVTAVARRSMNAVETTAHNLGSRVVVLAGITSSDEYLKYKTYHAAIKEMIEENLKGIRGAAAHGMDTYQNVARKDAVKAEATAIDPKNPPAIGINQAVEKAAKRLVANGIFENVGDAERAIHQYHTDHILSSTATREQCEGIASGMTPAARPTEARIAQERETLRDLIKKRDDIFNTETRASTTAPSDVLSYMGGEVRVEYTNGELGSTNLAYYNAVQTLDQKQKILTDVTEKRATALTAEAARVRYERFTASDRATMARAERDAVAARRDENFDGVDPVAATRQRLEDRAAEAERNFVRRQEALLRDAEDQVHAARKAVKATKTAFDNSVRKYERAIARIDEKLTTMGVTATGRSIKAADVATRVGEFEVGLLMASTADQHIAYLNERLAERRTETGRSARTEGSEQTVIAEQRAVRGALEVVRAMEGRQVAPTAAVLNPVKQQLANFLNGDTVESFVAKIEVQVTAMTTARTDRVVSEDERAALANARADVAGADVRMATASEAFHARPDTDRNRAIRNHYLRQYQDAKAVFNEARGRICAIERRVDNANQTLEGATRAYTDLMAGLIETLEFAGTVCEAARVELANRTVVARREAAERVYA